MYNFFGKRHLNQLSNFIEWLTTIGQTKETVASINKMVNEADHYYKEQRKNIDAIPLVVRLHNVTIRDIEKHLFRIESLLNKFKDVPWIDCLI